MESDGTELAENPFILLELPRDATPVEIERQKQKLLGMLELGLKDAERYATALGPAPRSAESVRRAAEKLSRPEQRLVWELWTGTGEEDDPLGRARQLHDRLRRRVSERSSITAADLDEVGAAWDEALLDEDYYDELCARGDALGADPDAALDLFVEAVEDQLLAVIDRAPAFDLDELGSELAGRAAARYQDHQIELLELACERFVEAQAQAPGSGWPDLRAQVQDLVSGRGAYLHTSAFYAVYSPLADCALSLYDRGLFAVAGSLFGWLRVQAEAIGDEEAFALQRDNARACVTAQRDSAEAAPGDDHDVRDRSGAWFGWIGMITAVFAVRAVLGTSCGRSDPPEIHLPEIRIEAPRLRLEPGTYRDRGEPILWDDESGNP